MPGFCMFGILDLNGLNQHLNSANSAKFNVSVLFHCFLDTQAISAEYSQFSICRTLKGPAKMFEIARVQDIEKRA